MGYKCHNFEYLKTVKLVTTDYDIPLHIENFYKFN